jgi:hypothetical protein
MGEFLMKSSMSKFLAAGTSVAVVASTLGAPAFAVSEFHPFKDVSSNYEDAVSFLYLNDFIKGVSSNEFGTSKNLTRGDAAVILANALQLDTKSAKDAGFKDLNSRIAGAVNALYEAGIISGVDEDTFAPNKTLTRGAMAKILVLGFELEGYETETPFTDSIGVFKPYIEALYGTGITMGKSETEYGKDLNITRGDFANLLYRSFEFVSENFSLVESMQVVSPTSFKVNFVEALPEDIAVRDVMDLVGFEIHLADGVTATPTPSNLLLSADRKTLTVEHTGYNLTGKEGAIFFWDYEQEFDFAAPVAGEGNITLAGVTEPISFHFDGGTTASVELPSTDGIANLDGIEFNVEDTFATSDTVTVILKSTTVEAAKPGEGLTWGTLKYENGKWTLVDDAVYDVIPAGNYVLEAPFTDNSNNTTTLTLNVTVK